MSRITYELRDTLTDYPLQVLAVSHALDRVIVTALNAEGGREIITFEYDSKLETWLQPRGGHYQFQIHYD